MRCIVRAVICVLVTHLVQADYECLCSYKVEMPVNVQANRDSGTVGTLYEFDCKPIVKLEGGPPTNWQAIAFEQQLGYVFLDSQVTPQICPGNPSPNDLLTTQPTVSTTPMVTTSPIKSTVKSTRTLQTSTTSVPRKTSASTKLSTRATTTSLPSTTTPSTTTAPTVSSTATTVAQTTPSTRLTSTLSSTTTSKLTTTLPPVTLGDVRLCPHTLHQYTIEDQGALAQYGDSCYEIVPIRTTWLKAEKDCVAKGGHLFHISNQREQVFILLFINSNKFAHACWTGLHDIITEEHFQWVSGDNVTYTNWWHDRKGNFFSHHTEDCVLFVPFSPYFGKWDDAPCGSTSVFNIDQGQINPFICQFGMSITQSTVLTLARAGGKTYQVLMYPRVKNIHYSGVSG